MKTFLRKQSYLVLLAAVGTLLSIPSIHAARSLTSAAIPKRPPIEISLAGDWNFQMDPRDQGIQEEWFNVKLPGVITLPGSLLAQGYGNPVTPKTEWTGSIQDKSYFTEPFYAPYRQPGNVKLPFWLTPRAHYVGASWYQKDVLISKDWERKHINLSFERSHWETTLWIDGNLVGNGDSLSTPHVYDVTRHLRPGNHRITLRVDNRVRIKVGENSHSISDHTQGNWNGVVGAITLSANDPLYIEDIQTYPDLASHTVRIHLSLVNETPRALPANVYIQANSTNLPARHGAPRFEGRTHLQPGPSSVDITYPLGENALLWDEFNPALYNLQVTLESASDLWSYMDSRQTTFGMRQVHSIGTQIAINGSPTFLRGTLECAIFPLTGYPPTDIDSWKRIIRTCKEYGLNHMRFHSWCPPEAAFTAADELGFYFQIECASWANSDSAIGDGQAIDRWITLEADRILKSYGNHPSFLMLAYGNEPAGKNQKQFLSKLVQSWKATDNRHLYTSAAGWPLIPESDFHSSPDPRIQAWGGELKSRINSHPPSTTADYTSFVKQQNKPIISHEIGQWCVYPNFREIPKYSGAYQARNFEIFRDHLQSKGMLDQADQFTQASGKLQALCYKEEIESALRTPGFGGFQLLDLHDFPGQGTALVGVLDPFWDSKGYISGEEFSRFCNSTVPLARLTKRVWTSADTFSAEIQLAHFGPAPLEGAKVYWHLIGPDKKPITSGEFDPRTYPVGNDNLVGAITLPLDAFTQPQQLKLVVGIGNTSPYGKGRVASTVSKTLKSLGLKETRIENDWDIWVYPSEPLPATPANILITDKLNAAAIDHLNQGGDLLLLPPPNSIAGDVKMGFSPIFWNTAWTHGQAPHTLGILCDPKHPALASFPTDSHSNWQWWDLIQSGAATPMDALPDQLSPIVQVIDDWFQNRKLGLLFEARLGQGRVLFSSMDLQTQLDQRPVARQMRQSLLNYMASPAFNPNQELTPEHLRILTK